MEFLKFSYLAASMPDYWELSFKTSMLSLHNRTICCSFLGKLAALINTIPGPVIGGISFLLYGMIGTSGLRMLVDNQVDYSKSRNLALTSVVFIVGLSGIALNLGNVKLTGMVLACVVAMALSLIFYILDRLHLTNDL